MQSKRVVITGMGVVSPVGTGVEKFWAALVKGQSGVRTVSHFDASAFDSRVNGDVIDYDPLQHFNSKDARNTSRFIQFGVVAAPSLNICRTHLPPIGCSRCLIR